MHLPGSVVDVHLGSRVKVDPGQDRSGHDHERALGRSETPVLVHHDIADGGLAGDELGDGTHLLDHHTLRDCRLTRARQRPAGERQQVPDGNTDEKKSPEEKKEGNGNRGDRPSRP